jgi:hypothetical protein
MYNFNIGIRHANFKKLYLKSNFLIDGKITIIKLKINE